MEARQREARPLDAGQPEAWGAGARQAGVRQAGGRLPGSHPPGSTSGGQSSAGAVGAAAGNRGSGAWHGAQDSAPDSVPDRAPGRAPDRAPESARDSGLLKAMSPGVVDYLFRQLVAGRAAADVQWENEGISLDAQPEGAELARRLSETDIEALTPVELFHYVRAAQRLVSWAEDLRQAAVGRYCHSGAEPRTESP